MRFAEFMRTTRQFRKFQIPPRLVGQAHVRDLKETCSLRMPVLRMPASRRWFRRSSKFQYDEVVGTEDAIGEAAVEPSLEVFRDRDRKLGLANSSMAPPQGGSRVRLLELLQSASTEDRE
jgi:hypothetical protein